MKIFKLCLLALLGFIFFSLPRVEASEAKGPFIFKLTSLDGMEFSSLPIGISWIVYIHVYDQVSNDELACNHDFNLTKIEVKDEAGNIIFVAKPDCRTNLGGIISTFFNIPRAGTFTITPISRNSDFQILDRSITVQ